jgi:hypothetical protein
VSLGLEVHVLIAGDVHERLPDRAARERVRALARVVVVGDRGSGSFADVVP